MDHPLVTDDRAPRRPQCLQVHRRTLAPPRRMLCRCRAPRGAANAHSAGVLLQRPVGFPSRRRPIAEALSQWDDHSGPFGRSPFQLFTIDRRDLQPLDGTLFWSQWSEMSLLPYTIYFDSAAHLIALLRILPLEALMDVSRATRQWHRQEAYKVIEFWRALTAALVKGDAATFKGAAV